MVLFSRGILDNNDIKEMCFCFLINNSSSQNIIHRPAPKPVLTLHHFAYQNPSKSQEMSDVCACPFQIGIIYSIIQKKIIAIMSTTTKIKNLIKCCDIFGTSDLLRYQKSNKFQTLTGGTLTLAIIIVSLVCFAGMLRSLADSANINVTSTVSRQSALNSTIFSGSSYSKFMFGIRVAKLNGDIINLSGQRQYFALNLKEETSQGGSSSFKQGQLVKCTRQHWIGYPDVLQNYDGMQIDSWLCPSPTFSFSLSGNSDGASTTVSIDVNACDNLTHSFSCASAVEMDQFFQENTNFALKLFFINPLINPSSRSHLKYYLSDSRQSIFSLSLGSLTQLYFSNYQIQTDQSVLSAQPPTIERGMMLGQEIIHHHYTPSLQMPIARITLNKSPLIYLFQRSYQQLAVVFAYFGGIASFTIIMFYLIKPYVQTYYQLAVSNQLFSTESADKTFHIFKFVALKVYEFLRALKIYSRWSTGNELIEAQQQIRQHLSVVELIKRVLSLENMMISLFDEFELQDRINCSITMEQAKALRIKLKSYENPHCSEHIKTSINVEKSFPTLFEPRSKFQKEEAEQYEQIVQNQRKLLENQFKIRLKAVTMLNKKLEPDFKLIQNETIRISPMIEEPPYLAKLSKEIEAKQMSKDSERQRMAGRFNCLNHKLRMRYSWKSRNSVSNASSVSSSYGQRQ